MKTLIELPKATEEKVQDLQQKVKELEEKLNKLYKHIFTNSG